MWVPSLFALSYLVSLVVGQEDILTPKEAEENIVNYIKQNYPRPSSTSDLCNEYSCCTISDTESCSISNMSQDKTTLVYPGGETRCIYSDSTAYSFQVIPGDSDKLLYYFQGGGACWDQFSTKLGFCSSDALPQSQVGIFNRDDERNAFRHYTIVQVLYCSGDVHGGNTTRSYNDDQGQPIVQVGLANAHSVLTWVQQEIAAGHLASEFEQLVIMGCSAGSIGAQLWGNTILNTLKWKQAAVVPDSYAGIFPPGSMGPLIYDFGFCTSGFLSKVNYERCINQQLSIEDIDLENIGSTPNVPYAFLQSKIDIVQRSFYVAIAVTSNSTRKIITTTEFYAKVNRVFGLYNKFEPNFVTYLVDGNQHCYTDQSLYYEVDTFGPQDNGNNANNQPLLYEYVNTLPLTNGQSISTQCQGTIIPPDVIESTLQSPYESSFSRPNNTYCANRLVPKTFVEQY